MLHFASADFFPVPEKKDVLSDQGMEYEKIFCLIGRHRTADVMN